jgi:uncharacterized protein YfcZ (UPF0381/DUF406 family)
MTRKVYRTAQGKLVDLGALLLQNENTRAVGNMPVNARGDIVDSQNKPIDSKARQVSRQYSKQTNSTANVLDTLQSKNKAVETKQIAVDTPKAPEDFNDNFVKEPALPDAKAPGGLAAAIAKARQVKQEPVKTSLQLVKDQTGVQKI